MAGNPFVGNGHAEPAAPAPAPDLIGDPDWLELLPEGVGDEEYRAAVRAEASVRACHREVTALAEDLAAQLRTRTADRKVKPAALLSLASDAAAARAIVDALPPVPVVAAERHAALLAALGAPAAKGAFLMPRPPLFVALTVHHNAVHAKQGALPPQPYDTDIDAVQEYIAVSAEVAQAYRGYVAQFLEPWTGSSNVGDRVRSWHACRTSDVIASALARIGELREVIEKADTIRNERDPHRCQFAAPVLSPPPIGRPWSLEDALTGSLRHAGPRP